MKITSVEHLRAAYVINQLLQDPRPQILFTGRSNVGKSSCINHLLGSKKHARISSKPGKTGAIHYYLVNRRFFFVDVPGYGWAHRSKQTRLQWKALLEGYLFSNPPVSLVCTLSDSRHGMTNLDCDLVAAVDSLEWPRIHILTKCDKVSGNQWRKMIKQQTQLAGFLADRVIAFSIFQKTGKDEVWQLIRQHISQKEQNPQGKRAES